MYNEQISVVVAILQTQLIILIIIAIGFSVTKAGMFSSKARADMTNLVIYIILPCNIFTSFHKGISPETLMQCVVVLLAALGLQFLYMILNKVLYVRFRQERRIVVQYATIVNNASFIGLPLLESVYGEIGLLYGSIILIPMRVFMWTAGLSLFTKAEKKQRIKVVVTHPCIWAVFLGFGYIFAPFELPAFLYGTITAIGNCNLAMSMVIIGSILSEADLKQIADKDCLYYSFFRLIAIPAILYGALALLRADPQTTGAVVLSSAMPAAATTAMLAEKYGKDSVFATKTVFTSTIISMVTLPVIALLLTKGV